MLGMRSPSIRTWSTLLERPLGLLKGMVDRVRSPPENEPPPLAALPYRNLGLPKEQVDMMDQFFRDARDQRVERERLEWEQHEHYERIKGEWQDNAVPNCLMN